MNPVVKRVDLFLNNITMYRLLLYGLMILLGVATFLSFIGVLSTSPLGILEVTGVLVAASYVTNKFLSYSFSAVTNNESYLITALILACILPPSTTIMRLGYIATAGIVAMASKFVISYHHKHIFNPAALGAVYLSLFGLVSVSWWIGNPTMLPFVAVFGMVIIRKLHHFKLVLTFIVSTIAMLIIVGLLGSISPVVLIKDAILSGPMIFFATVMLTEPATMPVRRYYQLLFALLVGLLFSAQLQYGLLATSPHMVLIVGNIFAFIVNPKFKANLKLVAKNKISAQVYDYVFMPDHPFSFMPGQYLEWTLAHKKVDGRGNRRSFTIASSPTEKEVHLGVKFYEPASSFKRALQAMAPGDSLAAGQLSGNFTMTEDVTKKLVFIAGGVGITPFRSMAKYLTDTGERRDIILFYCSKTKEEIAYEDIFQATPGLRFVPVIAKRLSAELLKENDSDFASRTFYISGPNGLVESYRALLRQSGVPASQIITDYFSGY